MRHDSGGIHAISGTISALLMMYISSRTLFAFRKPDQGLFVCCFVSASFRILGGILLVFFLLRLVAFCFIFTVRWGSLYSYRVNRVCIMPMFQTV